MNYNFNSGYGQVLAMQIAASVGPVLGRIHVVVEDSDPSVVQNAISNMFVNDPDGNVRFYRTLNAAYTACTTNANDVILLSAHSTHTITPIAWTKNRIHVIGMDGGGRAIQQGAKIQNSATSTEAYVVKVTGVRNSFKNIKAIQISTEATALTCWQFGGEGNKYEDFSATFGVVDNLDQIDAFEVVMGEDSGTFINCEWGTETLLTSAARAVMSVDMVTASQECKANRFINCRSIISSSLSTATHIRLAAVTDILFTNLWVNPVFIASVDSAGGAAIAETVQTGTGVTKGVLCFAYPATFNSTDFATATSGRNAGVQIVGLTTTAGTGGVGVQPTA